MSVKTYRVTTYDGKSTYTVSLDDDGVVDVDGLLPESADNLKASVDRHIKRRKLAPITALGLSIGSYSSLKEIESVADSL